LEKHLAPLIAPRKKLGAEWKSVFLNHIDAAAQKRRDIARFFSD